MAEGPGYTLRHTSFVKIAPPPSPRITEHTAALSRGHGALWRGPGLAVSLTRAVDISMCMAATQKGQTDIKFRLRLTRADVREGADRSCCSHCRVCKGLCSNRVFPIPHVQAVLGDMNLMPDGPNSGCCGPFAAPWPADSKVG